MTPAVAAEELVLRPRRELPLVVEPGNQEMSN